MFALRRSLKKAAAVLGTAVVTAALALGLSGCEPTDVDVYVPTRTTVEHADGSPVATTTRTLDEHGNAVRIVTEQGQARTEIENAYDPYGVVTESAGVPVDVQLELDDRGQPTRISVTTPIDSGEVSYAYYDVRGRIETASIVRRDGSSQTIRYDRDGWPLSGSRTDSAGNVQESSFVYEINEFGAVTTMLVSINGEDPLAFTYTYDENGCIATQTAPDGSMASYAYELVKNPSPLAMATALLRVPPFDVA